MKELCYNIDTKINSVKEMINMLFKNNEKMEMYIDTDANHMKILIYPYIIYVITGINK